MIGGREGGRQIEVTVRKREGEGRGGGQRKGRAKEDRKWELKCGRVSQQSCRERGEPKGERKVVVVTWMFP